MIQTVQLTV